ncbi:MAG: O-antigen ligase family protein [Acidobacteriota bacterium]|nr:O-antigen ligase family protein [Acidobacteriota bacterium]
MGFVFYALHLATIWGIAASNVFMGLATIAALVARRWRDFRAPQLARPVLLLGWFAFLFCLSVAFSYEPATSARKFDDLFSLLPFVLTLIFVSIGRHARQVCAVLVLLGTGLAVVGLVQVVAAGGIDELRIAGPFSHYQTYAGVLLLCDLLALASLGRAAAGRLERTALVVALAVMNVALFANLTRGSWVALVLALLFLVALRSPKALLAIVPALVVVAFVLPGPIRGRAMSIFDLTNGSNYDRLIMLEAGAKMIAERPVFGLGPELVEKRYSLYRHPTAPTDERPHLHNSYLQIAAERGLVALGVFLALLAASLGVGLRNYREEGGAGGPRADLHLGAAAALVAYTLAALFEDNWTDSEVQRVALFVIALPFCLHRIREEACSEAPNP